MKLKKSQRNNQYFNSYNHKNFEFQVNQIWGRSDNQQDFDNLMTKILLEELLDFIWVHRQENDTTMSILNQLLSCFQQQIIVSAFQIYNNDIYDLLTNKPLKYFKTTKLIIRGKSSLVIEQERDIGIFLKKINHNRNQNKTNFNNVSSRSRTLVEIEVNSKRYTIVDMVKNQMFNIKIKN